MKSVRAMMGWFAMGLALAAAPMRASGADVRDNAGLFSSSAVKQAESGIRTIQKEAHKDLMIETFPGIPEGRQADYERNREQFFTDFLRERARGASVDGVYVMLMKEPPPHNLRLQIGMGQATAQRAFRPADREQLVRTLQPAIQEKKFDDALSQTVSFVERTMKANLGGSHSSAPIIRTTAPVQTSRSSSSSMWGWVAIIFMFIAGFVVISIIMRVLRGGMGGGGGYTPGGYGSGGGGGFFSSLLGGIGGAMAGSWLYDRFFSNNANAGDSWSSRIDDNPGSDIGSDFSSSGRDSDDGFSSGGSDFGGDSGGGDSGGGDSGGSDF